MTKGNPLNKKREHSVSMVLQEYYVQGSGTFYFTNKHGRNKQKRHVCMKVHFEMFLILTVYEQVQD